ncbi:MAG: PDZ domain-containing protein [Gemmatales bacterium]
MLRWLALIFVCCAPLHAEDAPPLVVEVDARQLPRRLVHTTVEVPCKTGELRLWYPKWYPGSHGPMGRLEDVGGFIVETSDGRRLPWERDEVELFCVKVQIPEGLATVRVKMTTICNSPGVDAAGIYTYGNNAVGVINWNTCVLYPEGPKADEQPIKLTLKLPEKWQFATALKTEKSDAEGTTFKTVSLTELIDNPLVAGEHFRTIPLNSGNTPPAFLHIASDSADALKVSDKTIANYSRLVQEAGAMFGTAHYPEFHFLVTCSDELGLFGLEHLRCSINGLRKRDLIDEKTRSGWVSMLLPHEYVHSWCGKYRRPASMVTPNFHTAQRTRLLWVYEGLAQYLGDILMVRCGLVTPETYRDTLTGYIHAQLRKTGRNWRSLEDTSVAGYLLRKSSPNWSDLRRDQDFYFEGMLLWMECDAIIREESSGTKSLDDFCKIFFAKVPGKTTLAEYDYAYVVKALQQTQAYDWDSLLSRRVRTPLESLPLDFLTRLGYRMEYSDKPSSKVNRNVSIAEDSLGLRMAGSRIMTVAAGSPADKANLAVGMRIIEVNGEKYSVEQIQKALAESVTKKSVELQVQQGESKTKVVIPYEGGLRFRELKRLEDKPDGLLSIYQPRVK